MVIKCFLIILFIFMKKQNITQQSLTKWRQTWKMSSGLLQCDLVRRCCCPGVKTTSLDPRAAAGSTWPFVFEIMWGTDLLTLNVLKTIKVKSSFYGSHKQQHTWERRAFIYGFIQKVLFSPEVRLDPQPSSSSSERVRSTTGGFTASLQSFRVGS